MKYETEGWRRGRRRRMAGDYRHNIMKII